MNFEKETFGTAFNCMDGRCQKAVTSYVERRWGVQSVDVITEPGMDAILAGKHQLVEQPSNLVDWIKRKGEVSAKGHHSSCAVVVGHAKCAGNQVSDADHSEDIRAAVRTVQSWGLFTEVVGLMATEGADGWQVSPVEGAEVQAAAAA